jgi:hypothetical protein
MEPERERVERLRMVGLGRVPRIGPAPTLVERHLDHDGQMVVAALDRLDPFARETGDLLLVEQIRVGHLARDEKSHPVGAVEAVNDFRPPPGFEPGMQVLQTRLAALDASTPEGAS